MRGGIFGGLGVIIIIVLAVVGYSSLFVVDQTHQGLVLRFGRPVRVVTEPGLYAKVPLVDNVVMFDNRLLDIDTQPNEVIARDRKRLVVDAFARYRIVNPLLFYQAAGSIDAAETRLSVILNSAIRSAVGQMDFSNIVRDGRAGLMETITQQVNAEAQRLGIDVVDVRIRSADLPEANSEAVYKRMQTERQREATDIRARGEQEAKTIRAQADRQATVIVAEANQQSEELRGDGDAAVNRIFATAYGKDPEFFAFFRSLQAYVDAMKGDNTRIVISPDSAFFRFFNDPGASGVLPPSPSETSAAPAAPAPAAPAAATAPAAPPSP